MFLANRVIKFPQKIMLHFTLKPSRETLKTSSLCIYQNITSQSQSCDAGIIQNFKVKYRKQLLKHVISKIDDGKNTSEIIQGVDHL